MAQARQAKKDDDGLSELERRFATEYLVDFNATQAYLRAAAPNKVKITSARANGSRLLKNPLIQQLVRDARDQRMAAVDLKVEDVMAQLKAQLLYDPRRVFDQRTGGLLPMDEWPDDVAAAVIGVKDTVAGREIKFTDKSAALDKAMRYFGLFERDNKQQAEAIAEVVFKVVKPGGANA